LYRINSHGQDRSNKPLSTLSIFIEKQCFTRGFQLLTKKSLSDPIVSSKFAWTRSSGYSFFCLGCGAGFMFWRLKISTGGDNLQLVKNLSQI